MAYLLGLDISTTGAKALLIDEAGKVAASATTEYPPRHTAAALVRAGAR